MNVMFVLVGFSLLVALVFLGVFIWAVRTGQYEDKFTPSVRILFDADEGEPEKRDGSGESKGKSSEKKEKEPDIQEHRSKD